MSIPERPESPDAAALLGPAEGELRFRPGETLWRQDQGCDQVLLLRTGVLKRVRSWDSGRQTLIVLCGPGELLGAVPLLGRRAWSDSGHAVTLGRAAWWGLDAVLRAQTRDPLAMAELLACSQSADGALGSVQAHADGTVSTRTARLLLDLVERFGMADERGLLLPLPLSRGELASMVGCRVESVVRVLRSWVADGVLDTLPGGVLLLRAPQTLRELAAG